jgi:hypothetical protein
MIIPIQEVIDVLIDVLKYGRNGHVREALPGELPDFVQKRDKLSTGLSGRKRMGESFSIEFDPPFPLKSGVGYVVELD